MHVLQRVCPSDRHAGHAGTHRGALLKLSFAKLSYKVVVVPCSAHGRLIEDTTEPSLTAYSPVKRSHHVHIQTLYEHAIDLQPYFASHD